MPLPNDHIPEGLRVFVVEDESLVLFNLEDILAELKCTIVGPAMRMQQALDMAGQDIAADVAILDVNIGGQTVFPVAEALTARGIPVAFATGYGRGGLPEEWQHCPVLMKPYTDQDVVSALAAMSAAVAQ